jgi:O-antigen/teichoic acid export membrane protein
VVNSAFQFSNLISLSTWPEFSRLYGEKNKVGIKRLFYWSTSLGLWGCVTGCGLLLLVGPKLLLWWTRGEVMVARGVLIFFLISVVLNSSWYTASAIFNATNRHQRLSLFFLLSSILVPLVAWLMLSISDIGLKAVGLGFICMDSAMLIYVLPRALMLVQSNWVEWGQAMAGFPVGLIRKIQNFNGYTGLFR